MQASPPKKPLRKVKHVKVKGKEEEPSTFYTSPAFLHLVLVSIEPLNAQVASSCTMGRPAKVSIHCHLMNQRQRKPGNPGNPGMGMLHPLDEEVTMQHLILLTNHLVQATGGQNSRQIAGGNEVTTI